jgi:hypothetical protein
VSVAYRIRIEALASAPASAAPETAVVRLVALLPAGWRATLVECGKRTAIVTVTPFETVSAPEVARIIAAVVRGRALAGWTSHLLEHEI